MPGPGVGCRVERVAPFAAFGARSRRRRSRFSAASAASAKGRPPAVPLALGVRKDRDGRPDEMLCILARTEEFRPFLSPKPGQSEKKWQGDGRIRHSESPDVSEAERCRLLESQNRHETEAYGP